MNEFKKIFIMHIALFAAVIAFAIAANAACFPENTLFIADNENASKSGISEKVFNQQLDLVYHQFESEVEAQGFQISFNRLWKDGTVNSDTYESGNQWIINSYGGLARIKGMTADGYLAVACHELGHHMGGAPLYHDAAWASVEGGADYFATLRCLKEIGLSEPRIRNASLVLARVLASLGGEPMPRPETPDQKVVRKTDENHPGAQCRLDTYLKGLECPDQGPLSRSDAKQGTCNDYSTGFGVRPRCWFAP